MPVHDNVGGTIETGKIGDLQITGDLTLGGDAGATILSGSRSPNSVTFRNENQDWWSYIILRPGNDSLVSGAGIQFAADDNTDIGSYEMFVEKDIREGIHFYSSQDSAIIFTVAKDVGPTDGQHGIYIGGLTATARIFRSSDNVVGVAPALFVTSTGTGGIYMESFDDAGTHISMDGFIEMEEQGSEPAAPAANQARIWFRDNGSGKTQMMVRFATGASQVVATQP